MASDQNPNFNMNEILLSELNRLCVDFLSSRESILQALYRNVFDEKTGGMYKHISKFYASSEIGDDFNPWTLITRFERVGIDYVPIPKNGTNSFFMFMLRMDSPEIYKFLLEIYRFNRLMGLSYMQNINRILALRSLEDLKRNPKEIVIFFRNPLNRFVSAVSNKFSIPLYNQTIGKGGGLENFASQIMHSSDVGYDRFALKDIIKYLLSVPSVLNVDGHFRPQSSYVPNLNLAVNIVDIKNISLFVDEKFGKGSNRKLFKLNSSDGVDGAYDVGAIKGLLDKPLINWTLEDNIVWRNISRIDSFERDYLLNFISNFYSRDFSILSDIK